MAAVLGRRAVVKLGGGSGVPVPNVIPPKPDAGRLRPLPAIVTLRSTSLLPLSTYAYSSPKAGLNQENTVSFNL